MKTFLIMAAICGTFAYIFLSNPKGEETERHRNDKNSILFRASVKDKSPSPEEEFAVLKEYESRLVTHTTSKR